MLKNVSSIFLFNINTVIVTMHREDSSVPPLTAEMIFFTFYRTGITRNDDFGLMWAYSAQQLAGIQKCRLCPLTF
jgi:hypothetical protein